MSEMNRKIVLAARPEGYPKDSDFRMEEEAVPELADGKVLVRTRYASVDPYMRGRMNEARAYADPIAIGGVMGGASVGDVVASKNDAFKEGDAVVGAWGWQDYGMGNERELQKVDTGLAPISAFLGIMGMPGMTAYFGFLELCAPKAGDSVFISGAAGAVGALVGQIAKIKGCYVTGSAGTDEKVEYLLKDVGFDAAFNYKNVEDFPKAVRDVCPKGVDCYFDNVGGAMSDAVLMNLNEFARISICGQISMYNAEAPEMGPRLNSMLLIRQARMEGFLVFRWQDRYAEGMKQMGSWLKDGKLKYREDVLDGLENSAEAFMRMLRGGNKGKQVVRVSGD